MSFSAFQHGSYPVITPHNETFPPDFNTQRTELHKVELRTNGKRVFYSIINPRPGSWFGAMYLLDKAGNKIKQKVGLSGKIVAWYIITVYNRVGNW